MKKVGRKQSIQERAAGEVVPKPALRTEMKGMFPEEDEDLGDFAHD